MHHLLEVSIRMGLKCKQSVYFLFLIIKKYQKISSGLIFIIQTI